ncbi:MAG: hypothetical protein R2705_05205 [Ilumatobacteraceae bacterium]
MAWPVDRIVDALDAVGLRNHAAGISLILVGCDHPVRPRRHHRNMRRLVADRMEQSLNAVLGRGGGLIAMVVGLLITVAVQSPSITTSILVPLAGSGARAPQRLSGDARCQRGHHDHRDPRGWQRVGPKRSRSRSHTLFNLTGIASSSDPLPPERSRLARRSSWRGRSERKALAVAYVVTTFIVIPLLGVVILS